MQEFLAALMALVSSFAQLGKPTDIPPMNRDEVILRGSQVSEIAKNLKELYGPFSQGNSNSEEGNSASNGNHYGWSRRDIQNGGSGSEGPTGASGQVGQSGSTGPTGPDTGRVSAVNLRSGMQMPTFIPRVAIDNSPALDYPDPNGTPYPTPPGQSNRGGNGNGNAYGHNR